jgi:Flp pilus assembly pilin Flp
MSMKAMNLLSKLVKDEQGGEVLEYALIAGLIVVAAIAAISSVGTKVLARWTSLNSFHVISHHSEPGPRGISILGSSGPRVRGLSRPRGPEPAIWAGPGLWFFAALTCVVEPADALRRSPCIRRASNSDSAESLSATSAAAR